MTTKALYRRYISKSLLHIKALQYINAFFLQAIGPMPLFLHVFSHRWHDRSPVKTCFGRLRQPYRSSKSIKGIKRMRIISVLFFYDGNGPELLIHKFWDAYKQPYYSTTQAVIYGQMVNTYVSWSRGGWVDVTLTLFNSWSMVSNSRHLLFFTLWHNFFFYKITLFIFYPDHTYQYKWKK